MILADGILGQMMEPVEFPEHAQVKQFDKPWATTGTQGKRKKNIINSLFLQADELETINLGRFERYQKVMENEQRWEEFMLDDAEVVVVAYGASARIAKNAIRSAREKGIKVGLIRPISLWPFPEKVLREKAKTAKAFVSVELSMGQMINDVRLAIECTRPVYLCNRVGGMVMTPDEVEAVIVKAQGGAK